MGTTNRRLGDFELVERVGAGGMAQVWRGRHLHDGFEAALKFVTGRAAASTRAAFSSEIRKVAGMRHPNVVRIWDFGHTSRETELADGEHLPCDSPWIAMELAAADLDTLRVTNWRALQRALLSLLDGLAYAHARGLLHCDLKPANVLMFHSEEEEFSAKLSDFGIARLLQASPQFRASDNEARLSGTPSFMAPEQWVGAWRDYTPATDLYGFGCMAYSLASGGPPFVGDNAVRLALAHREEPVPVLRSRFDCPTGFDAWLARLLAKRPSERFQRAAHAAETLRELSGAADHARSNITPAISAVAPTLTMDIDLAVTTPLEEKPRQREHRVASRRQEPPMKIPTAGSISTPTAAWQRRLYATHHAPPPVALIRYSELPVVGRDADKEALWAELETALHNRSPRLVLFEADEDSALPHLQRWLCLVAHENGVAEPFWVEPGAAEDPVLALARSIERGMGAVGLSDEQALIARIRQHGFDDEETQTLAGLLRSTTTNHPPAALTDTVLRAFDRLSGSLLPLIAFRRPPARSDTVDALLQREGPRLVAVVGSSEELAPFRGRADFVCKERDWSEDDFRQAVRALLLMEPRVAEHLYEVCRGRLDRSPNHMRKWASDGVVRWNGDCWTWVNHASD